MLASSSASSTYALSTHALAPLYERGIAPATLDHYQVKPAVVSDLDEETGHWFQSVRAVYPIYAADGHHAGWRSKRLHPRVGLKNRWHDHEDTAAHWVYGIDNARRGKPYLLYEGDPDMWLGHTLGIPGGTLLAPVAGPQPEAIGQLRDARPSLILTVYDNDDAGRAGALRTVRALRDAGLTADALALPAWLPDKGDVTDLYHALGRDRDRLVATLRTCERMPIPAPAPPRPVREYRRGDGQQEPEWDTFNRLNNIVDVAARVGGVTTRGRVARMLCPFHDDRHPSLQIHADDGHFYCPVCRAYGRAYDLYRGRCRRDGQIVSAA